MQTGIMIIVPGENPYTMPQREGVDEWGEKFSGSVSVRHVCGFLRWCGFGEIATKTDFARRIGDMIVCYNDEDEDDPTIVAVVKRIEI